MGYIRISWPDSQKYTALPEDVLETLEEEGTIIFGDDGSYLIDEDEIDAVDEILNSLDNEEDEEEHELPEDIKSKISSLAEKYSTENGWDDCDFQLKKTLPLNSRPVDGGNSNVYAFYVYKGWIYLLDDNGADMDPEDVEIEFLEKFLDYISDESNVTPEED